MRMKLETEVMRQKARDERNQRRLEGLMRIFSGILAFAAGMTFVIMVTRPDAKGIGITFAVAFVGAVVCWVQGEPR